MKYAIYKFRYTDSMSLVCYKNTEAEAIKEIDRLAKEEEKKKEHWFHGDPIDFTFMPIGGR